MIVDWAKQCLKIDKYKKLDRDDPSDNKSYTKQEIIYMCYLVYDKGYDSKKCFEEWEKISNGTAAAFKHDRIQREVEFARLYAKILKPKYKDIDRNKPLEPIKIYKDEIKYLNDLNVPLWVKQYWMCLLVYYKFMSQRSKRVEKSVTLNAWCMRQVAWKDKEYGHAQDRIAQYRLGTGKVVFQMYDKRKQEHYAVYAPAFIKSGGTVGITLKDINDVNKAVKLMRENVKICEKCGKKFYASTKCKRKLCDKCYEEDLKKRNNCSSNKCHKQKKLELIE